MFVATAQEVEESPIVIDLRLRRLRRVIHADVRKEIFTVCDQPVSKLESSFKSVALA